MLRCMHTMDIPYVFDNVDVAKTEIGAGPERQPLSDKMSAACGSPSHAPGIRITKGIPNWPAYTPSQRATMVWNVGE